MRAIIAHEISHAAVCLKYGDYEDSKNPHGPRWEAMMHQLGLLNPQNEQYHHLDLSPVRDYHIELTIRLREKGLLDESITK